MVGHYLGEGHMLHVGYKANLLQNARYQMSQSGGKIVLKGEHVYFLKADRSCVVWFPFESRVHDLEIQDMKDAITEMSGHAPFTLKARV